MKARPACAACILLRRALELEQFSSGRGAASLSWFRSVVETAGLYLGPDIEVALLASVTFRRLKTLLRNSDPYLHVKDRLLKWAMEVGEKVRELIERESELHVKLELALKAASYTTMAERGLNNFYVGTLEASKILGGVDTFLAVVGGRIGVNHVNKLVAALAAKKGITVYYLTGTVVELPFDMIVMDVLREGYGAYVVAVVRSEAYEDYVTVREAQQAGLQDHVDEIVETGSDSVTATLEDSKEVYTSMSSADLLIVKGAIQALYMLNNPPGPHLLLLVSTRCPIAASLLGVKPEAINIVFVEGRRGGQPG